MTTEKKGLSEEEAQKFQTYLELNRRTRELKRGITPIQPTEVQKLKEVDQWLSVRFNFWKRNK